MASLLLDSILNETIHNLDASRPGELQSVGAFDGTTPDERLFALQANAEMGQKERMFWVLIFSFMVLIAAGGNIIVIYIVSTNKEMKSVTNYFLVNLSAADTMVSILNVVFNFISMLLK